MNPERVRLAVPLDKGRASVAPQALPERVGLDQRVELGDQLRGPTERRSASIRSISALRRSSSEPACLALREVQKRQVGQRRPRPGASASRNVAAAATASPPPSSARRPSSSRRSKSTKSSCAASAWSTYPEGRGILLVSVGRLAVAQHAQTARSRPGRIRCRLRASSPNSSSISRSPTTSLACSSSSAERALTLTAQPERPPLLHLERAEQTELERYGRPRHGSIIRCLAALVNTTDRGPTTLRRTLRLSQSPPERRKPVCGTVYLMLLSAIVALALIVAAPAGRAQLHRRKRPRPSPSGRSSTTRPARSSGSP